MLAFGKKNIEQNVDDIPMYPAVSAGESYVDKKIEEAKDDLKEKQRTLDSLQNDIQRDVQVVEVLERVKKGKAVMYIIDILELINDYREKKFDEQQELLDAMEEEVIDCAIKQK